MTADTAALPESMDGWNLEGPPRRIDRAGIFDYMNGAGELYLGYGFDYLVVYRYTNDGGNELIVELYHMSDSRDAFGLLSLDWGGEQVELGASGTGTPGETVVPPARALYGKGLLRAWSDDLYLRIMAYRETPGTRETILGLGRMIAADRKEPPPPELLQVITPPADSPWSVRKDRTAYFYSHMVLNTFYYLSHRNILNLDHSTEAVTTVLERAREDKAKHHVRLVVIKYPDRAHASAALGDFATAYLPDRRMGPDPGKGRERTEFFHVEDGWLGCRLHDRYLVLVFECPDREAALEVLNLAVLR